MQLCGSMFLYLYEFFLCVLSFRSVIRRLKIWALLLRRINKLNRSPRQCHRKTLRGLGVLSASPLRRKQNLHYAPSLISAAPSCLPRHTVQSDWKTALIMCCQDVVNGSWLSCSCSPLQRWQSWRCSLKSQVQQAPWPALLTASWRRVNGSVATVLYQTQHCFCFMWASPPSERLKFWFFFLLPTESATAATGFTEARVRPAVRWTSLLSQHRRGKAASGINRCRWDTSQTGTCIIILCSLYFINSFSLNHAAKPILNKL